MQMLAMRQQIQVLSQHNVFLIQQNLQLMQKQMADGASSASAPPQAKLQKLRQRPPAPPRVPQELWDEALDGAPRPNGPLSWELREKSRHGLVHDARLGQPNLNARFVNAVAGLRIRKAKEDTDGSRDEDWRQGVMTREDATLGVWLASFDDAAAEERVDCGRADLYDANPLAPVLDPDEDSKTCGDGRLLTPADQIFTENQQLCLELYTVEADSTQTMFWQS